MSTQQSTKKHVWIIAIIAIGFVSFMMGYSFSPFMEVGISAKKQGAEAESGEDLMKQYEDLYNTE